MPVPVPVPVWVPDVEAVRAKVNMEFQSKF